MVNLLDKITNTGAVGYSYIQNYLLGRSLMAGMPPALSIELTNFCNLKCPECSSGSGKMTRSRGYMELSLFDKIIGELKPYLLNLNLYFQGEPMLHPQFFSFIARSEGTRTTVSTNGHFLSKDNAERIISSGLRELIISLDGMDQETYSSYRVDGDVTRVMEGISNVSEAIKRSSSKMKLVIQFLVNRRNEHQIPEIRNYSRRMNASLKLKSMQIINCDDYGSWLPTARKFRRYELKGDEYVLRGKLPNHCLRLWFSPVVTWDGKILPCCFDKNGDHIMGDLKGDSFREIWNGPKYRSFRRNVSSGRNMIEICRTCSSGMSGLIK
jgi:radical SAM protein with 4Fe4S-binding SPASM domain